MRAGHYLTMGLLMLGGCGQSSEAAPSKPQPNSHAASARFDLAGVAVGDSLASATSALRQRGFSIEMHSGGWSFDDWVENSRGKSPGRPPTFQRMRLETFLPARGRSLLPRSSVPRARAC